MIRSVCVAACVLAFAGCHKDDDDSSSGGNNGFSLDGVGGGEFKNTAKSGKDVSSTLGRLRTEMGGSTLSLNGLDYKASKSAGAVEFFNNVAKPQTSFSLSQAYGLGGVVVNESEQSEPNLVPDFENLELGDDCNRHAQSIDRLYDGMLSAMQTASDALTQFDSQDLPKGVERLTPSDNFAVAYRFDLANEELRKQGQPQELDNGGTLTGHLDVAAGSSASEVGLAGKLASGYSKDRNVAAINGDVAVLGSIDTKTITLHAKGNSKINNNDEGVTIDLGSETTVKLVGGKLPTVSIGMKVDGTARKGSEVRTAKSNIELGVSKIDDNHLQIAYKLEDGQNPPQSKTITLVSVNGRCQVQQ